MRGQLVPGRFSIDYESKSIYEGIGDELVNTVGQEVSWWQWSETYLNDNYEVVVDDTYDVSNGGQTPEGVSKGRRWTKPVTLPVAMAQLMRSTNVMNERGYYVSDTLRLVVNVGDIERLIPDILVNPSLHIKDRIVYKGQVFVPTRVLPRGIFSNNYAVVTIDCNQVNPEEMVNDPQFAAYALPATTDARSSVATLGALMVLGVSVPQFDENTFDYVVSLSSGTTSVDVIPVSRDENSAMTINGTAIQSGAAKTVSTSTSSTVVSIVVVSEDESTTNTYTITLNKV